MTHYAAGLSEAVIQHHSRPLVIEIGLPETGRSERRLFNGGLHGL
jgi:hypothetical protein